MEIKKNDIIELCIGEMNNLGAGVGHTEDGRVVFVTGAVTGDTVRAKIIKICKTYLVARLEEIIIPSDFREDGFCRAPRSCGGCVYRNISYGHELELKKSYVKHAFIKAGLSDVRVSDVLHTESDRFYRNKAIFPLAEDKNGIKAGFFAARTHNIVTFDACTLEAPVFADITKAFCAFMTEKNISVYDEKSGSGLLRNLYLRIGKGTGEIMVCVVINGESLPCEAEFSDFIRSEFPLITSVMVNVNTKNTNVVLGSKFRCIGGRSYINDILCGRKFEISAGSFYQVNHDGAELLYGKAAELAGLCGKETLLDLYCGIGTIGLSMADKVKKLIGIEIVPEAVECAKRNAKLNGTENAEFYCGDASGAEAMLSGLTVLPDVVVLDPPRKGSTPELIGYIARLGIKKVVYISCDVDTLARDCVLFRSLGYDIGEVTPVDMFSRTGHVETVILLSRETNPLTVEVRMKVETGEVKEHPTYKRIQEYVQEKYGFKVHTAYIAEVKRMVGLDMHKAPNAVEQRKHEYHPCPPEKVEAIKDVLRHFGLIAE